MLLARSISVKSNERGFDKESSQDHEADLFISVSGTNLFRSVSKQPCKLKKKSVEVVR